MRLLPNSKMARGQTGRADRRIRAHMIAHGANQSRSQSVKNYVPNVEQLELWAVCSSVCSPNLPRQPQGSHLDPASAGSFLFGIMVRSTVARHRFQGLLISPVALGGTPGTDRAVSAHRSGPFGCYPIAVQRQTPSTAQSPGRPVLSPVAMSCSSALSKIGREFQPAKSWWFPAGCVPRRHLTAARKIGSTVPIGEARCHGAAQ